MCVLSVGHLFKESVQPILMPNMDESQLSFADILKNQQTLASNQVKIQHALNAIYNRLGKCPWKSPIKATVDYRQGSIGGMDSEGKPWSTNIERMASMNKELRRSKACYLRCLSEFGFPVQESEGTVGVSSLHPYYVSDCCFRYYVYFSV